MIRSCQYSNVTWYYIEIRVWVSKFFMGVLFIQQGRVSWVASRVHNEIVYCKWYDWSVVWSCDLGHVKAKQEKGFLHSEGTQTRWKDNSCFAHLVILIFMVFWHQTALCKVINQVTNSVNSDLPVFSSVQATSLWKALYHRRAKSLSRKLSREQKEKLIFCAFCAMVPTNPKEDSSTTILDLSVKPLIINVKQHRTVSQHRNNVNQHTNKSFWYHLWTIMKWPIIPGEDIGI